MVLGDRLAVFLPGAKKPEICSFVDRIDDELLLVKMGVEFNVQPTPVLTEHATPWVCRVHGHSLRLFVPLGKQEMSPPGLAGKDVEKAICDVCNRPQYRVDKGDPVMICGTCNDSGYVQSLHEKAAKIDRGTVPCPSCFYRDADR